MRKLPLLILCLLLQACTQTQKGLGESLRMSLFGLDDIQMTNQQIDNLPYASMYLRVNGGQQVFVVLGYDEQGQQKWITRNRAMLVTQHGRVVKTLDLVDNLNEVSNLQQDPLRDALRLTTGASWTRTMSWTEQGQLRAATVVSHFTPLNDVVLQLAGRAVPCHVWQEDVAAEGLAWRNTFWIDTRSGQVRQSRQMLGANYFPVAITILKPVKL